MTAATIYLSLMGPQGLTRTAAACHARTRELVAALTRVPGVRAGFAGPCFHEAVLLLDRPVAPLLKALGARGIAGGLDLAPYYPELGHGAAGVRHRDQDQADIERYRAALERSDAGGARRLNEEHHAVAVSEPVIFEYSHARARSERPVAGAKRARARSRTCPRPCAAPRAPALPEVGELEAVRHFTRLSQLNFSIDTHFYPLGSCTMKYNPKACNQYAMLPEFLARHPLGAGVARAGLARVPVRAAGDAEGSDRHAGRRALARWPARTASSPASP